MANKSGVDDLNFIVWVDLAYPNEHYVHGLTLKPDTIALCPDMPHAQAVRAEMRKRFPGATIFVNRSVKKFPVMVEDLPEMTINEKGEVFN